MAKKAMELKFESFISIKGGEYVSADNLTPEQYDEIMTKLLDDIMSADGYKNKKTTGAVSNDSPSQ